MITCMDLYSLGHHYVSTGRRDAYSIDKVDHKAVDAALEARESPK